MLFIDLISVELVIMNWHQTADPENSDKSKESSKRN